MSTADNYVPLKELGNGSTVEFTDNWLVLSSSYLRVYLEDVTTGVQTLVNEGGAADEYTLVFDDEGFTVTFNTAPTSANYVVIGRVVAIDQTTPYKTSKGFQGSVTENSFDKLTAIDQDQQDEIKRALKAPLGSTIIGELPGTAIDGYGLVWDGTTGKLRNTTDSLAVLEGNAAIVVANLANIDIVAGIDADVTTVAGISANVTTVAGNSTNINTVAANDTNITTVAGISANVTTVAGISADVTTVAGIASDITDAANNIPKANRAATTDPDADNDTTEGYSAGSQWVNVTLDTAWVCVDATDSAAIWLQLGAGGGAWELVQTQDITSSVSEVAFTTGITADTMHQFIFESVECNSASKSYRASFRASSVDKNVSYGQQSFTTAGSTAYIGNGSIGYAQMSNGVSDGFSGALVLSTASGTNDYFSGTFHAGAKSSTTTHSNLSGGFSSIAKNITIDEVAFLLNSGTFESGRIHHMRLIE